MRRTLVSYSFTCTWAHCNLIHVHKKTHIPHTSMYNLFSRSSILTGCQTFNHPQEVGQNSCQNHTRSIQHIIFYLMYLRNNPHSAIWSLLLYIRDDINWIVELTAINLNWNPNYAFIHTHSTVPMSYSKKVKSTNHPYMSFT